MTITKIDTALGLLRKPEALLLRQNGNGSTAGFYITPRGGRVSDAVVQLLMARNDLQPHDSGLLPGHPQSWRLGNWREWGRP